MVLKMGVKWTCALLCILGTANLPVDAIPASKSVASIREAPQISFRNKRDVNTIVDDNGNQVNGAKSPGDDGHNFSFSSTTGTGTGASSSSSSGSAFGLATPRIGGGPSFGPSGIPSGNSQFGSSWAGVPKRSSWSGNNQNYYPNVGPYPYYPNQYSGPYGVNGFNFQDFMQQYFRALEAQHQAMQAQLLQAQPRATSGSYSWAQAGAYMTGLNGGIDPNARTYSHSSTFMPTRSAGRFHNRGGGQVRPRQRHNPANLGFRNQNRYNSFGFNHGGGFGNGFNGAGSFNPGVSRGAFDQQESSFPKDGNTAIANTAFGPEGGFQYAEISPAGPGIVSRFADTHPPSSGGSFSVSSHSSSSSNLNPDGTVNNQRSATSIINDNGKVTVRTVKNR